jgi:hypothetical protein
MILLEEEIKSFFFTRPSQLKIGKTKNRPNGFESTNLLAFFPISFEYNLWKVTCKVARDKTMLLNYFSSFVIRLCCVCTQIFFWGNHCANIKNKFFLQLKMTSPQYLQRLLWPDLLPREVLRKKFRQ